MKENRIDNFLNSIFINSLITIFIFASIILFFIASLGSYTVKTQKLFEVIDLIILAIFASEFILKIVFTNKNYFFKNYGWIDFLAALPVLIPLFKYLILQSNSSQFLESDAVNIAIMFRGLKFIRFLRILRAARLFKVLNLYTHDKEEKHPELSINGPVVFSIILLITGFIFSTVVENRLKEARNIEMGEICTRLTEESIPFAMSTNPDILILNKDFNFERTMTDAQITENFRGFETSSIKKEGTYILYSVKDIQNISKKFEIFSILAILIFIIYVFINSLIINKKE